MKRGQTKKFIPTLRHTGFNGLCAVVRLRKGRNRWTRIEYNHLTRASANRWIVLHNTGRAQVIRDANLEIFSGLIARKEA